MKHLADAYINFIDLYEPYCYDRYIMNHIIASYNIITALNEKWSVTKAASRLDGTPGGL